MLIDSGFFRRLKFYLFGFLIGALAVNFIFKGRACRLPGSIKLEELREQKREYTSIANCKILCNQLDTADISRLLNQGKINYDKSNVHDSPFPTYSIEGTNNNHQKLSITIADCDSVSKITDLLNLSADKDTCGCN